MSDVDTVVWFGIETTHMSDVVWFSGTIHSYEWCCLV